MRISWCITWIRSINIDDSLDDNNYIMKTSNSRAKHLMQLFQMENDYTHHRHKINTIKNKNAKKEAMKSYHTQVNAINSFQKNSNISGSFKVYQRQKTINHENKLLHNSLMKQYSRSKPNQSMNSTVRSNRSERSLRSSIRKSQ